MEALAAPAPGPESPTLEVEADITGVDPCDVACEAMPAHVVGDLCARDEGWLRQHIAVCTSCANELRRYDRLNSALTVCGDRCCADVHQPPPLALPPREKIWYTRIDSPVGELILAATREGLREIDFAKETPDKLFAIRIREGGGEALHVERIEDAEPEARWHLQRAATELNEYFAGNRARFDVPLDWGGMAPFQRAVLEATVTVPFGHVDSYAGIARRIGNPKATRAVGNALGRNPIPVIVPCHRVIRSDASLGGYTGGLGIKQRLLHLEGVTLA